MGRPPSTAIDDDPVRRRREQVRRWTTAASRLGYALLAVAVVAFFVALATGFTSTMATIVVGTLIAGSVLLVPSIVLGYAIKAADRADRDDSWRRRGTTRRCYHRVGMPPRLSAVDRREQLLAVALSTFAGAGYHETSMNDVADAAGVTKPVLYQHFESKRDLYQALLDDVGHRLVTAVTSATADAENGRQRTERGFRAYFHWVAENREAFLLLFGGSSRVDPEFAEAVRRVTAQAADAIAPLIDVGRRRRASAHPGPRDRRHVRGRQPTPPRARRAVRRRRGGRPARHPRLGRSARVHPRHGQRPATESVGVAGDGASNTTPPSRRSPHRATAAWCSAAAAAESPAMRRSEAALVRSAATRWCSARQSITIAGIWARW